MSRKKQLTVLSALAIWLATLLIAAVFLLSRINVAREFDEVAATREQQVVANGIENLIDETARAAVSETVWDEAVANLDNEFSVEWAHENVGVYFSESEGFEAALVLNADDETVYAMRDGERASAGTVADLLEGVSGLVGNVRQQEAARGPLEPLIERGATMSSPLLASEVARIAGEPYILTAVLVQPDFGESMPLGDRAPIVITAEAIDDEVLARLTSQFLLQDGHLHERGPIEPDRAISQMRDSAGRVVATLDWAPPRPGAAMLNSTLPTMLGSLFAFAALISWLYLRSRRAAEAMIASQARATHLAYHDALTGMPNRLLLTECLERALDVLRRDGAPFAVHCIDLDHFKEVNDTYGHGAGDELVRVVARMLSERCTPNETLSRLGGDEFAIIQANASPESAKALAEMVVELLAAPLEISVGRVFIGCSVGIALVSDPEVDSAECFRRADLALYRAKAEGRSCLVFFEEEMDATLRNRLELREDLRAGLAAGELRLVYQPQVHHGDIYGVEALLRWEHPERGMISPAVFVPIAEQSGLIEPLGLFTLRRAFEDSHRLPGMRVAVNVSAAQLRLKDFVPNLRRVIEETGVDTRRIELEITEGLLLGDDAAVLDRLQQIRSLGLRIALDDFGTGYSSLSYLQRYPIDKIKIDRSFIANLGVEGDADAVVSAIVRLALALRLDVIAEGVETEAQRLRLAAAGCGDIQGYLFGKPMSLESLVEGFLAQVNNTTSAAPAPVATIA